ncbi:DUF7573 domain-containing protein [Halalkalirubrum salinum]|uniref:DUF7573 domain-containing protein n=1 Tax=Halalkalirubrum salinum TaxID=2563889 RepID=UPI0010FB02AC|nr:hypothetical protein [Halalkalirubrum salinum]
MGENRSLDDFLDTSSDTDDDAHTDPTGAVDAASPDSADPDTASAEPTASADSADPDTASAEPTAFTDANSQSPDKDSPDNPSNPIGSIAVYRFSPEPTECPGCGVSVTALWRDGDRYVCRSCKDW